MADFLYGWASQSNFGEGDCGAFLFLIQQKTVTKFIVTVSAWQLVPTRLFALGFPLG